jgi:hypothetical protein
VRRSGLGTYVGLVRVNAKRQKKAELRLVVAAQQQLVQHSRPITVHSFVKGVSHGGQLSFLIFVGDPELAETVL